MTNSVIIIGNLVRDPEVRYTQDQMAIANLTVAVERPPKKDGTKEVDYPRVVVFGKQAENCGKYLTKGKKVCVEGRIQTGSYEKSDGTKVYTTDIMANRIEFLTPQNASGGGTSKPQNNAPTGEVPAGFQAVSDDDIPF